MDCSTDTLSERSKDPKEDIRDFRNHVPAHIAASSEFYTVDLTSVDTGLSGKGVNPMNVSSHMKVTSLVKVASSMKTVIPTHLVASMKTSSSTATATPEGTIFSSVKMASSVKVVSSAKPSSFERVSERMNIDCDELSLDAETPSSHTDKNAAELITQKALTLEEPWGEEEAVSSEEGAEAMSEGGDSLETEPEVVTERDAGFKVNWLALRDAATDRLLWATDIDLASGDPELRVVAKVPKEVLHLDSIHRELNFSTAESLDDFRLEQRILFKGRCLEEWHFHLGAVEPTSSQTWTSVFHSTPECQLMPFETLNGHLVLYTCFLDGSDLLAVSTIEIVYV